MWTELKRPMSGSQTSNIQLELFETKQKASGQGQTKGPCMYNINPVWITELKKKLKVHLIAVFSSVKDLCYNHSSLREKKQFSETT